MVPAINTEEAVVPATWFADRLSSRRARDVATAIAGFVRCGELRVGARLPTIREMSAAMGVSVGTIAEAWNELREGGLIVTNRRGGTVVVERGAPEPLALASFAGWDSLDLASGTPDPRLQPPLDQALLAGLKARNLHASRKERATPPLIQAIQRTWPFVPQAWTTAGGGVEGELLAIAAAAQPGGLVAIEAPTSPRMLDALGTLGLRAVNVECDAHGPLPEALAQALALEPQAFVFQPRAQLPVGFTLEEARAKALADVLLAAGTGTIVVENDATGPVAQYEPASLGRWLPDRILHVRAYCKTYGVDLRTCVLAGAAALVERVDRLRSYGGGVNSRILQDALAFLETDAATAGAVARARAAYGRRRAALAEALAEEGVALPQRDGLVVWLPVRDEATALVSLARHGIGAGPGRRCYAQPVGPQEHIRIAVSHLPEDRRLVRQLARRLRDAMRGETREEFD